MRVIFIFSAVVFGALIFYFIFSSKNGFIASHEAPLTANINLINKAQLPIERPMPALVGISDWINSQPKNLKGKVVLVDFWTYSCINCIRTLPYLSEWYKKYKDDGLVIIGVHSPEFDFEKEKQNVEAAVKRYDLEYPIALDSNHETWNAFANQYWPAHYLVDVNGNIRYHHFGEGNYQETEAAIQQLLLEAGLLGLDKISEIRELPPQAQYQQIGTPEIYLGYLRINNVGNIDQDVRANTPHQFSHPETVEENRFYFEGIWKIEAETAVSAGKDAKLVLRYKAGKVHMVMASDTNQEISAILKLDGLHLTENNQGKDVTIKDKKSFVNVRLPRAYNVIDTGNDYDWHTLEIEAPEGLRVFTFTFG